MYIQLQSIYTVMVFPLLVNLHARYSCCPLMTVYYPRI